MDENDIKAAVLSWIRRGLNKQDLPVVASEFRLNGTGIRADLAILTTNSFVGFEIKSEYDSLRRLPSQIEGYIRYFDVTYLVLADKHVDRAADLDLQNAKLIATSALSKQRLRRTDLGQATSGMWMFHLLTAEEERRANKLLKRSSAVLNEFDLDAARREQFKIAFRKRYGETSERFWNSVTGRRIIGTDVQTLSRFHHVNILYQQVSEDDAIRSKTWLEKINAL